MYVNFTMYHINIHMYLCIQMTNHYCGYGSHAMPASDLFSISLLLRIIEMFYTYMVRTYFLHYEQKHWVK